MNGEPFTRLRLREERDRIVAAHGNLARPGNIDQLAGESGGGQQRERCDGLDGLFHSFDLMFCV
jgi:hypothetical protein